ncbi:MAG: hypothetical protein J2P45_05215 [Candidatus Dormibacteraeota bacterium]|nr:hypothetical protein [Candidatus Dormibacteraeota bacterium]
MPDWATAVIAVEMGTAEALFEPFGPPGRGRILAHSALIGVGGGSGHLTLLDRGAWEEALAVVAGEGQQVRALRCWDAVVEERPAAPADAWYLSVAADLGTAALEFDDPAVTGGIRRTLAGYLPLLGDRFVATSTLMPDWRHCVGALTVFRAGSETEARTLAGDDPWRAVFPGRLFRLDQAIFRRLAPPAGPGTQRYGGANPWPGGAFA